MDADRFDTLTRTLAAAGSRRRALAAALSGTYGLLGLAYSGDATAGGTCKPKCNDCATCKTGKCKKTKRGKKCKKGICQPLRDGTPCPVGTCQSGNCAAVPVPPPVPPPFCAGKNTCADGNPITTCQASGPDTCLCLVSVTGAPFCGLIAGNPVYGCPANACPAGQTCADVSGGHCGSSNDTQCFQPCATPL